jgi:hypothetical protein
MLNINQTIKRTEGIVEVEIDGELVMMSIENGAYYGLDTVASRVWELIENPQTIKVICDQLLEEFDVTKEQCLEDIFTFLNAMDEQKVIDIVT